MLRVVKAKKGIPSNFWKHPHAKGLIADFDVGVDNSKLKAKVLVFKNCTSLKRFWRYGMKYPIPGANGCCHPLYTTRYKFYDDGTEAVSVMVVDPRYFCIIGFNKNDLNQTIITHESVHAAFAYSDRYRGKIPKFWLDNEQERICYPAGNIASGIARGLDKLGL